MTRDGDSELLTSTEVAAMFRVARSTVSGWAARGLLPYARTPSGTSVSGVRTSKPSFGHGSADSRSRSTSKGGSSCAKPCRTQLSDR
ncbi:helix-turn-helix domain-containing protein [Actinomadura rupiterrae]|uniref:helix-turn-helix domain-containing protein n=1 Tax=Actinomadura rupiterrae TaxID=559627 RepID=UPI003558230A